MNEQIDIESIKDKTEHIHTEILSKLIGDWSVPWPVLHFTVQDKWKTSAWIKGKVNSRKQWGSILL